jgi:hypothetical protein
MSYCLISSYHYSIAPSFHLLLTYLKAMAKAIFAIAGLQTEIFFTFQK